MSSGMFASEPKLKLVKTVFLIKKLVYSVIHESFQDFIDVGEKRDGSVVPSI